MAKSENSTKIPADNGAIFHPETLPKVYALELNGDWLDPVVKHGQLGVYSPLLSYEPGDFVAIFFNRRYAEFEGTNVLMKRLVIPPPPGLDFSGPPITGDVSPVIVAEQLNPRKQYFYKCKDILAIHRCVGWCDRGNMKSIRLTDADYQAIYGQQAA